MDAKLPDITLGETVCIMLKRMYFPDTPWQECYKDVANKFSELKAVMRKFYTGKTDLEILHEIRRYSEDDISEAFCLTSKNV